MSKLKTSTMKAIIFAAGMGTRLKNITDNKPKALVEVYGVPLLEIALRKLKYYGFKDIIVNLTVGILVQESVCGSRLRHLLII